MGIDASFCLDDGVENPNGQDDRPDGSNAWGDRLDGSGYHPNGLKWCPAQAQGSWGWKAKAMSLEP